ncbi:hypothetical protein chiPu_0022399 [Chiloscyllium punctatum]|uniref:TGF-beta propeptide domain-containing protein n=1 Tax=Chiloscyllium punctatum TaxID=137246 RepID=A0A401RDS3_CHIPU|nr:hypothetical protein [Chiloscyllium punctatum]
MAGIFCLFVMCVRGSNSAPMSWSSPEGPVLPAEPDIGYLERQEHLKEAYASLAARDEEIRLIQRGEMTGRKKPPRTKEILEEGFRKYMQLLYAEAPHIEIPEIPIYDPNEQQVDMTSLLDRPHQCKNIVRGFFPPLALPEPWCEITEKEKQVSTVGKQYRVSHHTVTLEENKPIANTP